MTKTTSRVLAVSAALLLIAAIGWAFMNAAGTVKAGKVTVSAHTVDFGAIPAEGGPVSREITVTNSGEDPLKLNRLSTSCGCTTAEMDMTEMAPGETRTITITFDPQVHPDLRGSIVRVVYLQTSDPDSPEIEIDVEGSVIDEKEL